MGDEFVTDTLRNAIAIAADDGFRVSLPSSITSPLQKSLVLAEAIRALPASHVPDCIFTGAEAPALNSANIPAMLAAQLQYPFVSYALSASYPSTKDNASTGLSTKTPLSPLTDFSLQIKMERDNYLATLAAPLPAVISFTKTPYNPGHPSVPGILKSQNMVFPLIPVTLPEPADRIQPLRTIPLRKDRDTRMIGAEDAEQKAHLLIRMLTESGIL